MYKRNIQKSDCDLNNSIIKSIEDLHKKMDILKENIESFKTDLTANKTQYSLVVEVLGENTIAVKNAFRHPAQKYSKILPIKSVAELKEFEELVDERNEKEISATVRALIGSRGIKKSLQDLIIPKVLVEFNLDGNHNKMRLLNFQKFINIFFVATYNEKSEVKPFKEEIRTALSLAKNRFFKDRSLKKKKGEQACGSENETLENISFSVINDLLSEI